MLKTKIVSSLEKALLKSDVDAFPELKKLSALKGERISFQLLHTLEGTAPASKLSAEIELSGSLAPYATLRDVCNVGIERPMLPVTDDDNYITKEPALIPDVLRPLHANPRTGSTKPQTTVTELVSSVWIEIDLPRRIKKGRHTLTVQIGTETMRNEHTVTLDVVNAQLPEESIYLTQWFHCDCLASYYDVPTWSPKHWRIIENFARVAVKNGINMLLTPTFTPPLDTRIGGERPTAQLVGVTKTGDEYAFDFTLLDRWIRMCDRVGIKYFEIAHFFTQWGAQHAPKVMATVDGEYKRIFGWETEAAGTEYRTFLRAFVSAFLSHMKARGDDGRCFFHISDEPSPAHIDDYKAAKAVVADLLEGYTIMDALSNYDFWRLGLVETPIPANNHIAPFIENKVPNLWTYYCCCQSYKVSNRLIAMPSWRNRSIGYQFYKYDIAGFLQWGYNFYYCYLSTDLINPFLQQDGDAWIPAGDAYSVYPAQNGEAWESLRLIVFAEALQDMKAMRLAERYCGRDAVVSLIDEALGGDVTFETCAKSAAQILELREKINLLIKKALKK